MKVDAILVNPKIANRAGGMVVGVSPLTYRPAAAVTVYRPEVTNRKLSSWSFRPPLVVYSNSNPYATKENMIPMKHKKSQIRSCVLDDCGGS